MDFQDLVKNGSIPDGTLLVWSRRARRELHFAEVVGVKIQTSDGVLHKSPSGAARHLNGGRPIDGWKVWRIELSGKLLDDLRTRKS